LAYTNYCHSIKGIPWLGLTGYYKRFIQNYVIICKPLFVALKKGVFTWGKEQQGAFDQLKKTLTQAPVLALPDHTIPFILEVDACGYGVGAVLMQNNRPIAYMSKAIGPKATGMSTYDKEALAIIEFLKRWKHYFAGSTLIIRTDQQSLRYIQDQKLTEKIQHKLLVKLLDYDYKVEYKKGRENKSADALSRVDYSIQANAITVVTPAWVTKVQDSYREDDQCKELLAKLSTDGTVMMVPENLLACS
jgi:hypothetical protein